MGGEEQGRGWSAPYISDPPSLFLTFKASRWRRVQGDLQASNRKLIRNGWDHGVSWVGEGGHVTSGPASGAPPCAPPPGAPAPPRPAAPGAQRRAAVRCPGRWRSAAFWKPRGLRGRGSGTWCRSTERARGDVGGEGAERRGWCAASGPAGPGAPTEGGGRPCLGFAPKVRFLCVATGLSEKGRGRDGVVSAGRVLRRPAATRGKMLDVLVLKVSERPVPAGRLPSPRAGAVSDGTPDPGAQIHNRGHQLRCALALFGTQSKRLSPLFVRKSYFTGRPVFTKSGTLVGGSDRTPSPTWTLTRFPRPTGVLSGGAPLWGPLVTPPQPPGPHTLNSSRSRRGALAPPRVRPGAPILSPGRGAEGASSLRPAAVSCCR